MKTTGGGTQEKAQPAVNVYKLPGPATLQLPEGHPAADGQAEDRLRVVDAGGRALKGKHLVPSGLH